MVHWDVVIVRFLPFILFVMQGIVMTMEFNGCEMDVHALHGQSAIYALAMFFISLANKNYHCQWNRAMYAYLVVVPLLNYLDVKFDFIPYDIRAFYIAYGLHFATAITTAFLAIRHFYQVIQLKKKINARNSRNER